MQPIAPTIRRKFNQPTVGVLGPRLRVKSLIAAKSTDQDPRTRLRTPTVTRQGEGAAHGRSMSFLDDCSATVAPDLPALKVTPKYRNGCFHDNDLGLHGRFQ